MGFFLQLPILLWKNFTLKKRSPIVVMFEMFLPLVLFVILLIIRNKLPAYGVTATRYNVQPLPSSGVVSVMQAFCDSSRTDEHGFPEFPRSTASKLLKNFQNVAEHNNFFDPGFSVEQMDHLPDLYRSIIDDPAALHNAFEQAKGWKVSAFLTNKSSLLQTLAQNFSIPTEDIDTVLNAHINFTEVYRLLMDSGIFDIAAKIGQHRTRRDLSDIIGGSTGQISGILGKHLGDMLKDRLQKSAAVGTAGQAASRLATQMLLDHPQYLMDPEVMKVAGVLLGFNSPSQLDPVIVADVLKKILLDPVNLHFIVCDDAEEMNRILIFPENNNTHFQDATQAALCNMSTEGWQKLSQVLNQDISSHQIVDLLQLENLNLTQAAHRVKEFVTNLEEFVLFEENLASLVKLASTLPQGNCGQSSSTVMTTASPSNITMTTTTMGTNGTHHQPEDGDEDDDEKKSDKKKKHHVMNKYAGLVKIWVAMQTTICGRPAISMDKLNSMSIDDPSLTSKHQKHDIGILVHLLYSNPKILYSPNGTQADEVIKKADGIFLLLDRISQYATKWLNVSSEIREYLLQNDTKVNLDSIRNMQSQLHASPNLPAIAYLIHNDSIRRFIENGSVPSVKFFIDQLDVVDNAACSWLSLIKGIKLDIFKGFRTEEELVDYFLNQAYHDGVTVLASVVFTNMENDGKLPPHVVYKIRQNASFVQSTRLVREKFWYPGPHNWGYLYYQFGFVWIQDVIERAIVDLHANRSVTEPGSYVHQMPYPCYMQDSFLFMIEHVMPMCLTISWVYTVAMLVQSIVYEKEQRLKEVMKMMGLSNSVHWLAWFITTFVQMGITMAILTVMLKYGLILTHSNAFLIYFVLMLFVVATISFSFLISVCYSKAKLAAACAGIIYFITYVPYMYVAIREEAAGDKIEAWAKSLASLFSTTAFGLGAKYFAYYEVEGVGVQWGNIHISPVESDKYNLFSVMMMLIFDAILYGVLTWYIENIHPGSYGLPKPWYFPLTASYWMGNGQTLTEQCSWMGCLGKIQPQNLSVREEDQACAMETISDEERHRFESEPSHLPVGVCIDNLTKVYKTGKLAVNKLHINLYESQITSLLGHNGAGKTTTMSILTGLFPPTAGTATICGLDIRSEMSEIRKGLGMCPQHNVLFDKLTVEEHLWFYARLKGISAFDIQQEMDTMIEDIGMPKKRSSTVDCLSGGMKRKLSVAIAFVAGSRTVILDEPTAGVDPYARRDIWDLIIKYKQGRTIMLSTHHMDEADILCDRIAIMSSGSIVCCGSSLFLKSLYGEGYHLKIVKRSMEEDAHSTDSTLLTDHSTPRSSFLTQCDESTVTAFIQGFMPAIYLKAETSQELHYILPFDEARKGGFEKLFKGFDENLDRLRISSYGVVDTSLEEVFLKVTELAEQKEQKEQQSATADNQKNNAKETANMESHNAPLQGEPVPFDSLPTMTAALGDEVELGEMTAPHTRSHHRTTSSVSVKSQESVRSMDSVRSLGELSLSEVLYSGVNPRSYTELANQDDDELIDLVLEGVGEPSITGSLLYLQQFLAIIAKRFHYIRRNWKGLFSQILLPALFVCIAMTVALAAPRIKDLPPMVLSPAQYYNSTQPRGNFIPYSNIAAMPEYQNWSLDADTDDIVKTFFLPSGVSATCVLKTPFNSPFNVDILKKINQTHRNYKLLKRYFEPSCESVFVKGLTLDNFVPPERELIPTVTPVAVGNTTQFVTLKPSSPYVPRYYPRCKCSKGNSSQACSHDGFKYPPITQLVTSDFLQDISGDKDEDYYLATTNMYRLHRYGGFSLGLKRDFVPVDFGKHAPPLFRKLAVRHASKIWYNHKGLHSLPVYINTLNNAILRANLPPEKGDPAGYGITLINHPMTSTNNHLSMEYILAGSDVLIAIFIIGAMSFVPASFVVFLVYERSIKAKHLQCVSGVNRVIYWLANYTWDMCNYIIPAACCVLILKIFDIPAYVSPTNFPAVIALFLLYGWSITPMMYPASFVFNEPSTAYICLIVINLFIGITCIITSFMLQMFAMNNNDADLRHTHEILKNIFLLFPNYCLGRGLMDIAFNEYQNQYYFKTGQYDQMKSPFEWDLTSRNLAAMAGLGFIFFIITILCEFRFFMKPKHVSVESIVSPIDEDPDVANERRRVLHGNGRNDLLRLENLTKVYVTRKLGRHLATDRVCLGVPQGECFGLLGVNGAGKTTTFKMLTGDLSPTAGDAYLQGFSVRRDIGRVQEKIGYCPQFDALYDELTAREHLLFYSRLRGIAVKDEAKVVNWALQKLSLEKYADIASGTYSGGNKRKLSTAIALIGQPPVIFLDEPTSGMDPHSRRFLWDLILKLIKGGKSVILTSHSMEECEVLCTRLAIMVNGHFKCLGSTQHLKDRFGDGYTISVRVRGPNYSREVIAVKRFIERHFPLAKLKECHHNMVQYELPSQDLSLAYVFSCLEEAQRDLQVEDYSVNQNTLDNVFINFAKQQQELVHAPVSHDQNTPPQPSTPQRTRTRTSDITTPLSDIPESGDTDDDVVLLDDVNVDLEAITDDDDAALLLNQTGTRLAFLNTDVSMC